MVEQLLVVVPQTVRSVVSRNILIALFKNYLMKRQILPDTLYPNQTLRTTSSASARDQYYYYNYC